MQFSAIKKCLMYKRNENVKCFVLSLSKWIFFIRIVKNRQQRRSSFNF